jgi:hypothetical protein
VKKRIEKEKNKNIIRQGLIIIRVIILIVIIPIRKMGLIFIRKKVIVIKMSIELYLFTLIIIARKNKIKSYSKIYKILKIIKKNLSYNQITNQIKLNLIIKTNQILLKILS